MMMSEIEILRLKRLSERYGSPRSTTYRNMAKGVWPPPISLGGRAVGWLRREIDAVVAARIAGKSDDDIRALVTRLVAARKQAEAHNNVDS